jgi:hypothetical protein
MRRRKALAEHPFGTLKCRAGYRHFLVRGFDNACNWSRTAFALKLWQDSRVQTTALLPSLMCCSAVPRWL